MMLMMKIALRRINILGMHPSTVGEYGRGAAVRDHASDIHLEPTEEDMDVRFRIDGILRKVMTVPKAPE